MAIDNLPMFTAMNREEVKPPFHNPPRPMTSQEAHFAIMEKVNACINEVNNFEQRVRFEMNKFMEESNTENTGFKEAIQASYNAFMQTVQQEVNNFETDMQNNFDLYRNDVDKRFADFQTAIEKDFVTLQKNLILASDNKIQEMETLRVAMVENFTAHRNEVNVLIENYTTSINNHMTAQDGKIEQYKQFMVDNLPDNVKAVFEQKASNGEIAEIMATVYGDSRRFMGSLSYAEITALTDAVNGDYYYCTTDEHYYQKTSTSWVDIGTGDISLNNLLAFQTWCGGEVIDARSMKDGKQYENIGEVIREVEGATIKRSVNLYNPALQNADTISPHYHVNGVPYETTEFDNQYDCTAPIEIEGNTVYSLCLVPEFELSNKPWGIATSGVFFYDKDGNFISGTAESTFTTPVNAKTMRFNFRTISGFTVNSLNACCMLVKGSVLPETYEMYYVKKVDESVKVLEEQVQELSESVVIKSNNLYNPALQTADTISPHYYVNGAPSEDTSWDNTYNCTAMIEVEENETYTIALVPAFGTAVNPWNNAVSAVHFYDENKNYLSGAKTTTFRTPPLTRYLRFNYAVGAGVTLNRVNNTCMMVKGSEIPTEYEKYYNATVKQVFEETVLNSPNNEYTFENDVLTVKQAGTKWILKKHGNNNLFMIQSFGMDEKTITIGTDMLSPYVVAAVNNADGDRGDTSFTGGNHSYNQTSGTPTAETVLIEAFANNKTASTAGKFNTLTLHCRNMIQATNTCLTDGTGRAVIQEDVYYTFDGEKLNVEVHITPLEAIKISRYYALQLAGMVSYNAYGSKIKKGISGNYSDEVPEYIEGVNDQFRIRMHLDNAGIGDYEYCPADSKYLQSNGKAYFHPIEYAELSEGETIWYKGYFKIDKTPS